MSEGDNTGDSPVTGWKSIDVEGAMDPQSGPSPAPGKPIDKTAKGVVSGGGLESPVEGRRPIDVKGAMDPSGGPQPPPGKQVS